MNTSSSLNNVSLMHIEENCHLYQSILLIYNIPNKKRLQGYWPEKKTIHNI